MKDVVLSTLFWGRAKRRAFVMEFYLVLLLVGKPWYLTAMNTGQKLSGILHITYLCGSSGCGCISGGGGSSSPIGNSIMFVCEDCGATVWGLPRQYDTILPS